MFRGDSDCTRVESSLLISLEFVGLTKTKYISTYSVDERTKIKAMSEVRIPVEIPLDKEGMLGRECLECKRYFKVKLGTGPPLNYCHCPYCEYEGTTDTFWTPAQLKYIESVTESFAWRNIIGPALDDLIKPFEDLERKTKSNTFFRVTVAGASIDLSVPIQDYSEKDLETTVVCDSCGLAYSVYGVFARCPDCKDFNAFLVFGKALDIARKHLELLDREGLPNEIHEVSLGFVVSECVSAFDGLGKELRRRRPDLFPNKPRNLFQNLSLTNDKLGGLFEKSHSCFKFMVKMFHVRHLYEHNMGVIDEDFARNIMGYKSTIGHKYGLKKIDVMEFIGGMIELGVITKKYFYSNCN